MEQPSSSRLSMYVIYDHPDDAPNSFVVRRWIIGPDGFHPGEAALADTLEEARHTLRALDLHRVLRDPRDDLKIVETWV